MRVSGHTGRPSARRYGGRPPEPLVNTSLLALLGFALWTIGIVAVGVGPTRVLQVLAGKARPNDFKADVPHGTDTYRRVMRAHANCVENLPVFATLVLIAAVAGVRSPVLDTLSVVVLAARVGQTTAHISSGRNVAVNIRFGFFLVQLGCMAGMAAVVGAALLRAG